MKEIIGLCHAMSMQVVIEGVERKEEFDKVKSYGADFFQGYYFQRPVLKDELKLKQLPRDGHLFCCPR